MPFPDAFDFRVLVDLASDAVMVRRIDGTILYWNAGAERLYGWPSAAAVGRRTHDLLATIFPEPPEAIESQMARSGSWQGHLQHRTAAGQTVVVTSRWVHRPECGVVLEFNRDETDQRRAEQALATSRARFDFVSTWADIGVWSCDLPFDELVWNDACKAHFGLPSDARVTIDTFYERMHPADVEPTRAAIDRSVSSRVPYDVEYRTRQQDGRYRWIRAMGQTEYDRAGRPVRFEGVTFDVTTVRRADERLRELADAMPQIVWSADAEGRVDYVNRRWYELTGRTPGDPDVSGVVHADDQPATNAAFVQSVRTGEPYEREFRMWLAGHDTPRWFLGRALPVRDESGRITRWYATSTDIHEQKHTSAALRDSRDRLQAALTASGTGTFRWDIDSSALDWDDNLDRLFGLAPGATARSLPEFVRMVHPEDRQRVIDACARCAAEGADFVEEFRVVWPDGTVRWLFDQGRVFVTDDGRRHMTGACVDITERRVKEDALRAADRQKDEFLGMLAHEIRNPLAPMMYSTSILDRQIREPQLRRPLEIIQRQVTRMTRIVDDLLDVSRVTQGKIALRRERITVATLLSQCADATAPLLAKRCHTLHVSPVDPRVVVFGDMVRLAQVIENLLINAAKYTPDGGRIELSAEVEGAMVAIAVSDTGIGIAPDMLERVFDLFAQADVSLDRAEGGLGIGLTLVDRLTRLHGGHVQAHSPGAGQGSTFTVRLPRADAIALPAEADAELSTATARRVLIIDDNVDAAQMLQLLLETSGHQIRVAHDGGAGIAEAADFVPDVVLLDIGLPGRDGYAIVRELRTLPQTAAARIVATTGYGRDEDRARCLAAGFDDHVTKPIPPGRLERMLTGAGTQRGRVS